MVFLALSGAFGFWIITSFLSRELPLHKSTSAVLHPDAPSGDTAAGSHGLEHEPSLPHSPEEAASLPSPTLSRNPAEDVTAHRTDSPVGKAAPASPPDPAAFTPTWVDVGPVIERLRFAFAELPDRGRSRAMNDVQRMLVEAGDGRLLARAAEGGEIVFNLGAEKMWQEGNLSHASTREGWHWIHGNGPDGVMQELIVPERPTAAGTGKPLEIEIPVQLSGLTGSGGGQEIQFTDDSGRQIFRYRELRAWDANGSELAASMEWRADRSAIAWVIHDQMAQYPLRIDPLLTRSQGQLVSPDGIATNQQFGYAVDATGDWIAAGAPGSTYQGKVYLFRRDRSRVAHWDAMATLVDPSGSVGDRFGNQLRFLSTTRLVVANLPPPGTRPSLFVFERDGELDDTWDWVQTLQIPSGTGKDLGYALAGSEELLVAGTVSDEVFVWHRQGTGWVFGKRLADGQAAGTRYGELAVLVGDFLAVSEPERLLTLDPEINPFPPTSGRVTLYRRNQGGPNQWGATQIIDGTQDKNVVGFRMHSAGNRLWYTATGPGRGLTIARQELPGTLFVQESFNSEQSLGIWQREFLTIAGGEVGTFDETGNKSLLGYLSAGAGSIVESRLISSSGNVVVWGDPFFKVSEIFVGRVLIEELLRPQMPATESIAVVESGTTLSRFGGAVAMDGDLMVVGAPQSTRAATGGSQVGRAYVFRKNQTNKRYDFERALEPTLSAAQDLFGSSVAICRGVVAVGAPGANGGNGRVFIYDGMDEDDWPMVRRIDGVAGEAMGSAVAVGSSGWVAAGAPLAAGGGRVVLHRRDAGGFVNWGFVTEVANPSTLDPAGDAFGSSMAMNGDYLLVGAPTAEGFGPAIPILGISSLRPNAGRAYLFSWNGGAGAGSWPLAKALPRANASGHFGATNGAFGTQVALDGGMAAVSEPGRSQVHVFDRSRTATTSAFNFVAWEPVALVTSPESATESEFGKGGIAIRNRRLAVGDPGLESIHVFDAHGMESDSWLQSFRIRPPMATGSGEFASVFAFDEGGMHLVAGLPGLGTGEALVFTRSVGDFRPAVVAEEPLAEFAQQVSLDGDELLIGLGSSGVVIRRNGGGNNQWDDGTHLMPPDGFLGGGSGAVVLARDRAFIAQEGRSGASLIGRGRVNVFRRNTLGWTHEVKLEDPNAIQQRGYAGSMATDGEMLVVGHAFLSDQGPFPSAAIYRLHRDTPGTWTQVMGGVGFVDGMSVSEGACLFSLQTTPVLTFPDSTAPLEGYFFIPGFIGRTSSAISGNLAVVAERQREFGVVRFYRMSRPDYEALYPTLPMEEIPELTSGTSYLRGLALDGEFCAMIDRDANLVVLRMNEVGRGWRTVLSTTMPGGLYGTGDNPDTPQASLLSLSKGRLAVATQGGARIYDLLPQYERWRESEFSSSVLVNPALEATVWGDTAVSGESGLPNIVRAYHSVGLNQTDGSDLLLRAFRDPASGRMQMIWNREYDTHGIDVVVRWSPDLNQWFDSGAGPSGDIRTLIRRVLADDGLRVTESTSFENANLPQGFFRLEYFR